MEVASKRKVSETEIIDSDSDSDVVEINNETQDKNSVDLKPECVYGSKCYRINRSHLKEFSHPSNSNEPKSKRFKSDEEKKSSFFNFYLTKVNNVQQAHKINSDYSLGIQGLQ
jgi:hypothetical protein